jgi:hypothetical protein
MKFGERKIIFSERHLGKESRELSNAHILALYSPSFGVVMGAFDVFYYLFFNGHA